MTAAALELGTLLTGGTIPGQRVVDVARGFLGTPFVHQGRLGGVGLDCVGLLQVVAQGCGIVHQDFTTYPRRPRDGELERRISAHCTRVDNRGGPYLIPYQVFGDPGDFLLFWMNPATKEAHHVGIRTDVGMLHTHGLQGVKRVVEHGWDDFWRERFLSAWRLRAIT